MKKDYDIKGRLRTILSRLMEINLSSLTGDILNEELLGSRIQIKPRNLLYLFFEIEKEFSITIPEEDIAKGRFNTFNNIVEIIANQLCNKEQKVV